MPEVLERLPKWAQSEILRLRRDLASARETIKTMHGKDSRITFGYASDGSPEGTVPEGPVMFAVGPGENDKFTLQIVKVAKGGFGLDINGSRAIEFKPVAANHATVTLGEW